MMTLRERREIGVVGDIVINGDAVESPKEFVLCSLRRGKNLSHTSQSDLYNAGDKIRERPAL